MPATKASKRFEGTDHSIANVRKLDGVSDELYV